MRTRTFRKLLALPAAAVAALLHPTHGADAAKIASAGGVEPRHDGFWVARIRRGRAVRLRTRLGGRAIGSAAATTQFGSPGTLSVVERRRGWLRVVATGLPNGRRAWVRLTSALRLERTRVWLKADLSRRRLWLMSGRRVVKSMPVAVGRHGSPTPVGRFAITDKLDGRRINPVYGRFILALSGTQPRTPTGWTGGNRLAIHGAIARLATAATAGCLEAGDRALGVLARRVPLGAPIFIRR